MRVHVTWLTKGDVRGKTCGKHAHTVAYTEEQGKPVAASVFCWIRRQTDIHVGKHTQNLHTLLYIQHRFSNWDTRNVRNTLTSLKERAKFICGHSVIHTKFLVYFTFLLKCIYSCFIGRPPGLNSNPGPLKNELVTPYVKARCYGVLQRHLTRTLHLDDVFPW
jgi:hypothetical protein